MSCVIDPMILQRVILFIKAILPGKPSEKSRDNINY